MTALELAKEILESASLEAQQEIASKLHKTFRFDTSSEAKEIRMLCDIYLYREV